MAKISVLSPHVADLIAAGEVVERPSSVVKELMENSIDAGATALTVEIKNGGMSYIRVTDNGSGMGAQDAEIAFLRHATSKLRDERGLEAIGTLGFRGEALAAISAVSRVELKTCEKGAKIGTGIWIEGGELTEKAEMGCPDGTTIIVKNLFFNTPARLKFMKNDRAEGSAVTAAVVRCALSHPEISVRYIKDGKEECHTPGDGNTESCIYSLFGRDFASGMLKASSSDETVSVSGFISSPTNLRGNRTAQYFFVNGRHVKSRTLQAALEQAYKNSMFVGKFPACVLYINVSHASVDVNVHPAKTEVKFLYEKQVFDGVYYAVLSALESEKDKAEIKLSKSTVSALSHKADSPAPAPKPAAASTPKASATPSKDFFKTMPAEAFRSSYSQSAPKTYSMPVKPDKANALKLSDSVKPVYQTRINLPDTKPASTVKEPAYTAPIVHSVPVKAEPIKTEQIIEKEEVPYRIIGEGLQTYIIVEKGDSLFLIDKHAAHERVLFDKLKSQNYTVMTQMLLVPIVCDFSPEDADALLDNNELLEKFGFEISDFGGGKISIHQVPSDIDTGDARSVLEELCEKIRTSRPDPNEIHDKLLLTIACKAAIKAGRNSVPGELNGLVKKVMDGIVKYCPHGRPVSMELSRSSLDKNFKRS